MIDLLKKISQQGIIIDVKEGKLQLSSDTDINDEILSEIKANKQELISYLTKHKSLAFKKIEYQQIPKAPEAESYALSNAQRRLWLTSRIGDGDTAFNIPKTIYLDGSYDVDAFQKAVHAVIEQHEILRTIFKEDENGEPRQYILSSEVLNFKIDYQDLRDKKEEAAMHAQQVILTDSYKAFDLSTGPLLRSILFQLTDDQYVFYYNMHHIISDEWSKEILSRDVMKYYQAYAAGRLPKITPMQIQYKDYAAWQLSQLESPEFQEHKEFWTERLSGDLPTIDFPASRPRPRMKTGNGRSMTTFLSTELTQKVNQFIADSEGSMFSVILSALNVLINKYTASDDIILGCPITERNHPDLENQIGFYVNVLPSRNQIKTEDTFSSFYKRVKEAALNDFSHKQYPFDKTVEDLDLKYDQSRAPIYDLSLTVHNQNEGSIENINEAVQDNGEVICKFDIEFHFTGMGNTISFQTLHNTDVYETEMVSNLMQHFKVLLASLLANPDHLLTDLNYLPESELEQLLNTLNNTTKEYPSDQTVLDLINRQALKSPDAIALAFEGEKITYKELDERSNQLAHRLQKEGIGTNDLVPICVERSVNMVVGILGILKAGGAYVPIDPEHPAKRVHFILSEIDAKTIITSKTYRALIDEFSYLKITSFEFDYINIISLDEDWETIEKESKTIPANRPAQEDRMYIIYTSGSTGDPKGVLIEHRSVFNHILHHTEAFGINDSDNILLFSNYAFDASVEQLFLALTNGATLVLIDKDDLLDSKGFKNVLIENEVTHLHATPSYLSQLPFEDYTSLRRVIAGGEYCPMSLAKQWGEKYDFYNEYGPTETTVTSIKYKYTETDSETYHELPIGQPISNTQVYILDSNLRTVPLGVTGELCISGAGLAQGYFKSPELTSDKFVDHPYVEGERLYRTGDYARWLSDGNLQFAGRRDHQVKIRGHRIELGEIEAVLNKVPQIEQAVVIVKEEQKGMAQLVANVVCKEELDHTEVQQFLEDHLPGYMIPKTFVLLGEMPLTRNGKIDRKALNQLEQKSHLQQEVIEPATETEAKILTIWKEIFKLEEIGTQHNFFDLGGNSLIAVRMIARIRKELNIELSVKNLFDFNTIVELAAHVDFSLNQEKIKSSAQTLKQIM